MLTQKGNIKHLHRINWPLTSFITRFLGPNTASVSSYNMSDIKAVEIG